MKKLALALLAAVALSPLPIAHAAQPNEVIFEAVDSVWNEGYILHIEGLVQGESQPRAVANYVGNDVELDRCLRAAQLAQAKPGFYLFAMVVDQNSFTDAHCKLTRR